MSLPFLVQIGQVLFLFERGAHKVFLVYHKDFRKAFSADHFGKTILMFSSINYGARVKIRKNVKLFSSYGAIFFRILSLAPSFIDENISIVLPK
jgi:hypothetical protein